MRTTTSVRIGSLSSLHSRRKACLYCAKKLTLQHTRELQKALRLCFAEWRTYWRISDMRQCPERSRRSALRPNFVSCLNTYTWAFID
jgi:hypothetical protein